MKNDKKDFLANINGQAIESFEEEKFIKQKTNYKKWIVQIVIIGIALTTAFFLFNQETEVIDFTGMTYQDAAAWAESKDIIITADRKYSSSVEDGNVISQSIEPGEKVKGDTNIVVEVSKGLDPYENIPLPEFDSTWSRTSISRWLDQNGIQNFTFSTEESEEVAANYLISYRLIGSSEDNFMRSSEIEFIVSQDDRAAVVEVPDFLNSTLTQADIWSRNNEVNYTYSYEYSSIYERDRIMSQSVAAGDDMNTNDIISFVLSKGEETETLIMENFLNRTLLEADMWAKNNGIEYTCRYEYSPIYERDKILSQSIASNEEIETGQKISFTVSRGREITVPDFSKVDVNEAADYMQGSENAVEVVQRYMEGTKAGGFISQSVTAGTKVEEGADITVVYSIGDTVVIPDYRNRLKTEFAEWIRQVNQRGANITLEIEENSNSGLEYGKIISQSIYNEEVELSSNINLVISTGIIVPSFSGMSVDEASSYSQGISVEVVEVYNEKISEGSFISQSINAGTKVDEGTQVKVYYSLGDTISIPDYTGELKVDFEEWVKEQNEMGANINLQVYEEYNENIEYGKITAQSVYNDNIGLSENIKIIVSLGESYEVINFSSWSRNTIENYCERNELRVVFEEVEDSDLSRGRVVSQKPESGTIISKKDFIIIEIAD